MNCLPAPAQCQGNAQDGTSSRNSAPIRYAVFMAMAAALIGSTVCDAVAGPQKLPAPTGDYPVGRIELTFTDTGRGDRFTTSPGEKRDLVTTIWYPAAPDAESRSAPYMPDYLAHAYHDDNPEWPTDMNQAFASHSVSDAEVADAEEAYPVVLFSHGHGTDPYLYTTLIESIASQGFTVVGINHAFSSTATRLPGGRTVTFTDPWEEGAARDVQGAGMEWLITFWEEDIRFITDRLEELNDGDPRTPLADRLDLDRIAAMGHSLGGPAVGHAAAADPRIKATLHLDSSIYGGRRVEHDRPLLLFNTSAASQNHEYYDGKEGHSYYVVVAESAHMSYSDLFILAGIMGSGGDSGASVYGAEILALTNDYIAEFLTMYLRDTPAPSLGATVSLTRR